MVRCKVVQLLIIESFEAAAITTFLSLSVLNCGPGGIDSRHFKLELELDLLVVSILYDEELELELEHRCCPGLSLNLHTRRYTRFYIFVLY